MIHLTDETLQAGTATGVVLVNFWAPWCGPCRLFYPTLEFLAERYGDRLTVARVNIDENLQAKQRHGVASIPTSILFKDGARFATVTGNKPKDILIAEVERALA